MNGRSHAVVLLTALAGIACDSRERECTKLLAYVHQDIDAERDVVLARGPDATYLAALGLTDAPTDHRVAAMAEKAGLAADSSRATDIEKAKADFAVSVRSAAERLHAAADARLVSACKALPDRHARCIADYPTVMATRHQQLQACPGDDELCYDKLLSAWRSEHPDCDRLDEWLDAVLDGGST